jgi:hypothetical protein
MREPPVWRRVATKRLEALFHKFSQEGAHFLRAGFQFMSGLEAMSSHRSRYTNMFIFGQLNSGKARSVRFRDLRIDWIVGHPAGENADDFLSRLGLQFNQRLY